MSSDIYFIAEGMLGEPLTEELRNRLYNLDLFCQSVGGSFVSRQAVAIVVEQYVREREKE